MTIPDPLTWSALQEYVAGVVRERSFTTELDRVFILLVEEVGELVEQVGLAERSRTEDVAAELADVTLYVADAANGFGVDLSAALVKHGRLPRIAPTAPGAAGLQAWQAVALAEGPSQTECLISLVEGVGTLARCLRKRWSAKPVPEAAAALAATIRAILELANMFGVDLTIAIHRKEAVNAQRMWTF